MFIRRQIQRKPQGKWARDVVFFFKKVSKRHFTEQECYWVRKIFNLTCKQRTPN